jgi:hypothetical protein
VADWPEAEKPSFAGLCTALENRLARSGGMEALVPQNSSAQSTGEAAHSDSPQLSAVKSGRDLLDQAKLLSRWLSEQPQGWLASHRLIKTVRWDTVDQIPHSTVAVAPAWYRRNPSIALNLSGYIFRKTGPNWLSRPARCFAKGSIISGSIFSGTSGRGSAMPVTLGYLDRLRPVRSAAAA